MSRKYRNYGRTIEPRRPRSAPRNGRKRKDDDDEANLVLASPPPPRPELRRALRRDCSRKGRADSRRMLVTARNDNLVSAGSHGRAEPNRAEPCRAEPSRAESSRTRRGRDDRNPRRWNFVDRGRRRETRRTLRADNTALITVVATGDKNHSALSHLAGTIARLVFKYLKPAHTR